MKPLVSVIIPVFNQKCYLAETIESVLAQTYQSLEIIIVDDGSIDCSRDIIKDYAEKDKRISFVFQKNHGKPKAINAGVAVSKGKLLAFLDHDDLMLPKRIERQVAFHLAHPELDGTSCHSYYINEDGAILGTQCYPFLKTIEECKRAFSEKKPVICSFTGLMISKKVFLEIGGLRPQFWPCDDLDLINRLIENGYLLIIIQEFLIKYRIHASSTTTQYQWHLFKVSDYTNYCFSLRSSNKAEISFEDFIAIRKKDPLWSKWRKISHNFSICYLQKSNFSLYTKNYLKFIFYFLISSFLDPRYVLANVKKRIFVNKKVAQISMIHVYQVLVFYV